LPYCTQSELENLIPLPDLIDGTDDDRDGNPDEGRIASILDAASEEVDAFLEGNYTVPLSPVPKLCKSATLIFAAERVYARRRHPDGTNPFKSRADDKRAHLGMVRDGKIMLNAADENESVAAYGGNDVVAIRIR
jgi:phage gp36-like protein